MSKSSEDNGIYYFLGNITSHILHALPLYEELGGTFLVLNDKAKREIERYGVPVIAIDNKPRQWVRFSRFVAKPISNYMAIGPGLKKTTDFLNQKARVVLFYELFDFAPEVRLTKPKTVFLTHGNMLKDYMGEFNRLKKLEQYDYMAALGPYMKQKLLENGVEPAKLVDLGVARTDAIVKHKGEVVVSPALANIPGFEPQKKIIAYLPTFWGASSVYDTGLEIVRNMPPEYNLLFRPHPQTPQKILKKYFEIMRARSNVFYVPEGAYNGVGLVEIFDASSAIIGDVSSVTLEAILTEKPLVFAFGGSGNKQPEDNYTSIHSIVEHSKTLDSPSAADLAETLQTALSTPVDIEIWRSAAEHVFFYANGGSVQAIAKFVKSI